MKLVEARSLGKISSSCSVSRAGMNATNWVRLLPAVIASSGFRIHASYAYPYPPLQGAATHARTRSHATQATTQDQRKWSEVTLIALFVVAATHRKPSCIHHLSKDQVSSAVPLVHFHAAKLITTVTTRYRSRRVRSGHVQR